MDSSLENYEVTFLVSFYGSFFEVYFFWYEYCYTGFFPYPFTWNIFSSISLSVCVELLFWGGSLLGSICVGHVCLSILLFCIFWLGHLIHFHLKLLLIGIYSLPFCPTCVPLSFTVFLPVLKASPLASPAELVWWRYILWGFCCLGSSLFGLPL